MKILAAAVIAASLLGVAPAFAGEGGDPIENALKDHELMTHGRYEIPGGNYGYRYQRPAYGYLDARPAYRPVYGYEAPVYGYSYPRPFYPYGVSPYGFEDD